MLFYLKTSLVRPWPSLLNMYCLQERESEKGRKRKREREREREREGVEERKRGRKTN